MTSIFIRKYFARNLLLFPRKIREFRFLALEINSLVNSRQTCRQIQTRDRLRLERIHKKKQDSITRSREALKKLRRKNLQGLSVSTVPKHIDLGNKMSKARSISRLLYLYNGNKENEAMNLSNQVTTLRRLGEVYDKHKHEQEVFKKKNFHKKLLGDIVDIVTASSKELSLKELTDVVVALSRLRIAEEQKYSPFIKELQGHDMKTFTSDEIGMLCFAFAVTKNKQVDDLMREIEAELLQRPLISFSHSVLSEIAWAFTELSISADRLLEEVCTEILSRELSLFKSRDISLIALAFSRVETLTERVSQALHDSLYAVIENLKFPTRDIVALTVSLLRCNNISVKMFRRLDTILVSRRDFDETVSKELLEEFLLLLQASPFHLSETRKIIENVLHPQSLNSVFDVFFRPRMSWKTKVFKQSWFKVY